MRQRPLGKTGLQVSELSLGGLFVSSHGGNFAQGRAAICRARSVRCGAAGSRDGRGAMGVGDHRSSPPPRRWP